MSRLVRTDDDYTSKGIERYYLRVHLVRYVIKGCCCIDERASVFSSGPRLLASREGCRHGLERAARSLVSLGPVSHGQGSRIYRTLLIFECSSSRHTPSPSHHEDQYYFQSEGRSFSRKTIGGRRYKGSYVSRTYIGTTRTPFPVEARCLDSSLCDHRL